MASQLLQPPAHPAARIAQTDAGLVAELHAAADAGTIQVCAAEKPDRQLLRGYYSSTGRAAAAEASEMIRSPWQTYELAAGPMTDGRCAHEAGDNQTTNAPT